MVCPSRSRENGMSSPGILPSDHLVMSQDPNWTVWLQRPPKAGLPWPSCPEARLYAWGSRSSATDLCLPGPQLSKG